MEAPVLIQIDENPNCALMDGLIFQPQTSSRPVAQVRPIRRGTEIWCDITGIDESGTLCAALACIIEDSGDGACHLVFGGAWGLRLKTSDRDWDLDDSEQWGEPYLLLPGDGGGDRGATGPWR